MTRVDARQPLIALCVIGALGQALAPPQHVHVEQTGEHHAILHRHFQSHDAPTADVPTTEVPVADHDDDHVVSWLDIAYTSPDPISIGSPDDRRLVDILPTPPPACPSRPPRPVVDTSVHDPPSTNAHGLRAPPFPVA